MLNQFKQMAKSHAMKLMSNPKFVKLMTDPRVMNTIAKGFEIHGQVRSRVEDSLLLLADTFNLATKKEVSSLQRKLGQVQDSLGELQTQVTTKD